MSVQEGICQTLNLSSSNNEILGENFDSPIELKKEKDLQCHEYIDDLLPTEVSSSEVSSDDSSLEDDDSDCNESGAENNSDSYNTPSLDSSDTDNDVCLMESESEDQSSDISTPFTGKLTIDTPKNRTTNDIKMKGRPSSCIFVASLAAALTDDELCHSVTEKFQVFGKLNGVKVLRDTQNRPYAFVQYSNDHDALRALNLSQGTLLNDRIIRCEQARVNRTLFISCQSPIACREIEIFCEKFGELEQLIPSLNSGPNKPNFPKEQLLPNFKFIDPATYKITSWFAQFAYRDDAIRAFANIKSELDWTVHWVQNVRVPKKYNLLSSARKQIEDFEAKQAAYQETSEDLGNPMISIDRKSIFVGQLHKDTTTDLLTNHFKSYGNIFNLKLFHKPTTIFAFIEYDDESSAAAALEKENHSTFLGKTIHVQYKELNNHSRYVRREARIVHRDDNYSRPRNNNFYVSPQVTLAPPPINVTRHKSFSGAVPENKSGEYADPIAKGTFNLRRNSLPVHYTPLISKWGPTKSFNADKSVRDNDSSRVRNYGTHEDGANNEEDGSEGDDQTDGQSSDTIESECDTLDLIEGQSHISMTSYNGSSRGSSKFSKSSNHIHSKYDGNTNSFSYKPRRYSHPPNPYYQPNYYVGLTGYPGSPQSTNQSMMMYYPPLPMPPPEALTQSPYYQHNNPYGPNMIPMMMSNGHMPPPPPQHMLQPLPPMGIPATTLNYNHSRQNSSGFNGNYQGISKDSSHHVSFEEDVRPDSSGDYTDSEACRNNNRFQNSLRNKVPSFKPGSVMEDESDDYGSNESPEYLDY